MSALRLGLLLLCALVGSGSLVAAEEPSHKALQELDAPWYDSGSDDWQRIPERPPDWSLGDGGSVVSGFGWFVVLVVGGILIWLIIILIRGLLSGGRDEGRVVRRVDQRLGADLADLPMATDRISDPASALAAARARGDWRQAVVWLYALQLLLLDRHRLIRLRRGTTNGSYLQSVRASGPRAVVQVLQQSIRHFEQVHFGGQPCSQATFEELETAHDRLVAELPSEAAA